MQSLIWTFPAIMASSIIIGWAAELAALRISAGLALAILALLQTLPEFGVEAFIAWSGNTHLMLANLTGSLRLFVGLGWPVVFFIHVIYSRKGKLPRFVQMPKSFAVEATFLIFPVLYFLIIFYKETYTFIDGLALCFMYLAYLWYLNKQRVYLISQGEKVDTEDSHEELEYVPSLVVKRPKSQQIFWVITMFVVGGGVLLWAVHPFVEGLKGAALAFGMSEFVFIQWVAPFASEFPEKITAFNWARRASKVPMAIFNMVSSSVNQWTLLAGFVPIVYSLSLGSIATIPLDEFQKTEVILTIVQSILGILYLADLKFKWHEAVVLFALWLVQFAIPSTRHTVIYAYVALIVVNVVRLASARRLPSAWSEFLHMTTWIIKARKHK